MAFFLISALLHLTFVASDASYNERIYGNIDLTPLKGRIIYPVVDTSYPNAPQSPYTFAMSILSNDMWKRDNVTKCEASQGAFENGVMAVAWDDNGGCNILGYYNSGKEPSYPDYGSSPVFQFVHGNAWLGYNCPPSAIRRFYLSVRCEQNVELSVGLLQTDENFCISRLEISTKYACSVQTRWPTTANLFPELTAAPTPYPITNSPTPAPTPAPTRHDWMYITCCTPTAVTLDVRVSNDTNSNSNSNDSNDFPVAAVVLSIICGVGLFMFMCWVAYHNLTENTKQLDNSSSNEPGQTKADDVESQNDDTIAPGATSTENEQIQQTISMTNEGAEGQGYTFQ